MSRSAGSSSFTRLSPIRISPSVTVSSPAIMRSRVDLPQPDGPTSTTKSPSGIDEVDALHRLDAAGIGLADRSEVRSRPSYFSFSTRPFTKSRCMPDDDQHRRQHRQHHGRHHVVPLRLGVGDVGHALDAHDDRVVALVGGDDQRPEILVPAVDEEDHEERRHVGPAERDQDVAEELHRPGAVDPRRLDQLVRHGQEELAEQERGGRRGDQRDRQAGIGVQHPEVGDDLEGRHDPHLDRQHQRHEDAPEGQRPERKAEVDDGEGREDRDRDLPDRDRQRHDQAVHHHQAERRRAGGGQAAPVSIRL